MPPPPPLNFDFLTLRFFFWYECSMTGHEIVNGRFMLWVVKDQNVISQIWFSNLTFALIILRLGC